MKPSIILILVFLGTTLFMTCFVSLQLKGSYNGTPYLEFGSNEFITIALWALIANVFTLSFVTVILASEGKFTKKQSEEPIAIKYKKLRRIK